MDTGAIVGVLLVVALVGGIFYVRSRSKRRQYHAGKGEFGPRDTDGK